MPVRGQGLQQFQLVRRHSVLVTLALLNLSYLADPALGFGSHDSELPGLLISPARGERVIPDSVFDQFERWVPVK